MKFLHILVIAACAATSLAAQETRQVKLRPICFQHAGDLKKLFAVSGGNGAKAVGFDLYTTGISDAVDAVVTNNTPTFAMPEGEAEGRPKFKTITTAKAVPGPRQLAMFMPGETGGPAYRCFVVDDSLANFPHGIADPAAAEGWRAVNQTRWFTGTDKRDLAIGFIHPVTKQPTVNCYADSGPE